VKRGERITRWRRRAGEADQCLLTSACRRGLSDVALAIVDRCLAGTVEKGEVGSPKHFFAGDASGPPLHAAASSGLDDVILKLADAQGSSFQVNRVDKGGMTALCHAALKGHLTTVCLLIERLKADPNLVPAIFQAIENGSRPVIEALLARGVDLAVRSRCGLARTVFHACVHFQRSEELSLFFQAAEDKSAVHARDAAGDTALVIAVRA
jgi:ankyrin repeat protein